MTEVYQPVVIRELLLNGGKCSKDHLATVLAKYDQSVKEYYRKVLMRYPKATLMKHGIIDYDRKESTFFLEVDNWPKGEEVELIRICEDLIDTWQAKKEGQGKLPAVKMSLRYKVLKRDKGKCRLCGLPSSLVPIDVDHITPKSKADKNGWITRKGKKIRVNSEENLQALCFRCNRAKRNTDDTDFRQTQKLVRDNIPAIIEKDGRSANVIKLSDKKLLNALNEKLFEEIEEYLGARGQESSLEELVDIVEVAISIAKVKGQSESDFFSNLKKKRNEKGGFEKGFFLLDNTKKQ